METKMIGNKIAQARKKINLSQAQLATQLFISPQAVGKWERGESVPDILTISRLAGILGVDLNYFSENEAYSTMSAGGTEDREQLPGEESREEERQLLTNFSGSDLALSDFAGVKAHKRKFYGSALRGADFAAADMSGSSFTGSDVREARFDGANLTDCKFSAIDLTDASFNKTLLVRTRFIASDLTRARFSDVNLVDVKLSRMDLRNTIFERCSFTGVDFSSSDLSGVCLDGQTFTDVRFDKTALNEVSFKGATLKNVSFRSTFALTNRYYRALQTICFDGAMMDKLSYAALKGMGVDLSHVTTI